MSSPDGVDRPALMRELLALCEARGISPQQASIALIMAGVSAALLQGAPVEVLVRKTAEGARRLDGELQAARRRLGSA